MENHEIHQTETQTEIHSTRKPTSWIRIAEVSVLALVVISNAYFGYSLKSAQALGVSSSDAITNASNSPAVTSGTSTSSTGQQLQPAAIPKMVGGC